ncbi:MAG: glycosyltransferase family 4 protein [Flavobacteriaceae bacterium]|nr:glycosyltransferase family 4 protein [Flavobacteriaceae bacterium]
MKPANLKKENILVTYVVLATFVKRDILILEKEFQVTKYHFNTANKFLLPFAFLKQFFYLLFNAFKFKNMIIQSSGYVSFLPVIFAKLFNKKTTIIAIGTDCAKLPEINYGAHIKPILSWFTNFSFKHASLILPVHKSLEKSTYTYLDTKFPKQGIRNFIPNIKTPIVEMVNGYDIQKWQLLDLKRNDNSFLTVSFALDKVGYYRKGIDLIVAMAKQFPTYNFTIVGKVLLPKKCPDNLNLIKNVPQTELLKIYNQHQYYLQLSMFEGFPNALCEAMLCGCIPIGSNVAGIPDIIDDSGYILKNKNKNDLIKLIHNLSKNKITTKKVRNQIMHNFSLERREKEFIKNLKN